ncbi:MAG: Dam family site-specific DNA-(adenine-N6)-methyltransferase [Endomicrobium sp.]|jgi:DNA adenine methylase|nr:Dam family site-specific DNA-(adenine-N6)-methyltransferase [Endomicrobium sp.]
MNPMLKYRGGKSREIPLFSRYIPKRFDTYLEPFLGGGAVFFHLEPDRAIVNDVNDKLISFYLNVQKKYDKMTIELDTIQMQYENNQKQYKKKKFKNPNAHVENKNEALYYKIRDMYNNKIEPIYMKGVIYYFINKTAYSGMIRHNSSGEYNVPFGRYPNLNTKIVTDKHAALLKQAQLFNFDYESIFNMANTKDFMFLDPPYDCIFNDYGNIDMMNGFDEEQHVRLAHDFRNLNCKALMIIGKTPLTEKLYKKYIRDEYFKSYSVNIRNRFKADAKHIIVTNYKV